MLNEVSGATTASHRLPTHTSHHKTHSIVIALWAGKAPHMADVSNHQCQLSVSGALCIYRAVDSLWQWKLEREVVNDNGELYMMNKNLHLKLLNWGDIDCFLRITPGTEILVLRSIDWLKYVGILQVQLHNLECFHIRYVPCRSMMANCTQVHMNCMWDHLFKQTQAWFGARELTLIKLTELWGQLHLGPARVLDVKTPICNLPLVRS